MDLTVNCTHPPAALYGAAPETTPGTDRSVAPLPHGAATAPASRSDRPTDALVALSPPPITSVASEITRAVVPLAILVEDFIARHQLLVQLTPAMLEQLAWQQASHVSTCESSAQLDLQGTDEALHAEVRRSLGRLNCLNLLKRGDDASYQSFIGAQSPHEALSREAFQELVGLIQSQSPEALEILEASAFAAMSPTAVQAASQVSTPDSEEFLTQVAATCPDIMPIWQDLSARARTLLPKAYPPQTHLRHMLYTEGGENMFRHLRGRIREEKLSDEDLALWLGRWAINIAAFRAHENPQGAFYLDAPTAAALALLREEIEQLRRDPTHDVLRAYLIKRAQALDIGDNLYLAHLAAMMRIYRDDEADELKAWFRGLTPSQQRDREQSYAHYRKALRLTPTYEPAIYANLRKLDCDIGAAADLHDALAGRAQKLYLDKVPNWSGAALPPLSYRKLGFTNVLRPIVNGWKQSRTLPELSIDDKGFCTVVQ